MMMTMSQLAAELHVDRRQIHTWNARRARNGFPAPISSTTHGKRTYPLWDLLEVKMWHENYRPKKGGRPRVQSTG